MLWLRDLLVKPEEAEKYWNLFLAELSMTWCQWLWPRGERSSGPVHSYRCRSREGCDGVDPAVAQSKRGQEQSAQRSRCQHTRVSGQSKLFGPDEGRNSAIVSAGAAIQWTPQIATYVGYQGQLGRNNYTSNAITRVFSFSF